MAAPPTMRAAVIDGLGGPEVLAPRDLPVPVPGPGEVLVRVHAAGINAIDGATREGQGVPVPAFPAVLGWDLSGTVAATGPGAGRFAEGDEVFGMPRFPALAGAYAEYAAVPEADLAAKPAGVDHLVAAAVPMVALTAWQTLFEHGGLTRGQRVLVSGAAGGVGHIAVQLAADAGAEVIGTASPVNHGFVRALGADQVVHHRTSPDCALEVLKDVDLVVDPRGGEDFGLLLDALRPGGILVTLKGEAPGQRRAAEERGLRVGFTYVRPDGPLLERIAPLLADGRLRPEIQRVFRLEEIALAHALGARGHIRGRLVLDLT